MTKPDHMNSLKGIFFVLVFLTACSVETQMTTVPNRVFELSRHVMYNGDKIVTHDLMTSPEYCTAHFVVSPIGLGPSDGKGLRINYDNGQRYLFVAIDDDYPITLYDSRNKKNAGTKRDHIAIDRDYEFIVNILPNGIIVSQLIDDHFEQIFNYPKKLTPPFGLQLQCQRTGAVFKDIWVDRYANIVVGGE